MTPSHDKRELYEQVGLAHRLGLGRHPALVVVDMQIGFTVPEKFPLAWNLDETIAVIHRLIKAARPKRVPIVFTAIGFDPVHQADGGLWVQKAPVLRRLRIGGELVEIDPRLDRKPEDIVVVKQYASSFFGTHLASTLTVQGVDTAIVTGCMTSGCVRATVIDAISNGFRPIIPMEAVGDRAPEPHEANLFDMDSKYGDVMPTEDVLRYLEGLAQRPIPKDSS